MHNAAASAVLPFKQMSKLSSLSRAWSLERGLLDFNSVTWVSKLCLQYNMSYPDFASSFWFHLTYRLGMENVDAAAQLCSCVFAGNVPMLRQLLKAGADPNSSDYDKRTALHISAADGNLAAVSLPAFVSIRWGSCWHMFGYTFSQKSTKYFWFLQAVSSQTKVLVEEASADVCLEDRWGSTALVSEIRSRFWHLQYDNCIEGCPVILLTLKNYLIPNLVNTDLVNTVCSDWMLTVSENKARTYIKYVYLICIFCTCHTDFWLMNYLSISLIYRTKPAESVHKPLSITLRKGLHVKCMKRPCTNTKSEVQRNCCKHAQMEISKKQGIYWRGGVSPNSADYDGRTGLMLAAGKGLKVTCLLCMPGSLNRIGSRI